MNIQDEIIRDDLTQFVRRIMNIEGIVWGTPKQKFIVRYTGNLIGDSEVAYERLALWMKEYQITPLFRKIHGKHAVILVGGYLEAKKSNPIVNLILFLFTLFSVLLAGVLYSYNGPETTDLKIITLFLIKNIWSGWPFALSLLSILLAHEFGHYLAARYHKTEVTLPYFIPFPLSPFGTMGAFIKLKEPPRNKRVLLDIGVAGPLAGLVVAIPVLILGLILSDVQPLPLNISPGQIFEGNSILYLLLKYITHGALFPVPSTYGNHSQFVYWIRYFFTGYPLPSGGKDIFLHPVAWAGWAGLLVTALNLIPAGQLDGGHLIYVLLEEKAKKLLGVILGILFLLGFVWSGWWFWAFLIFILGRVYADPLDQITPLDKKRKYLAIFGLIVFVLVFTPVPIIGNF